MGKALLPHRDKSKLTVCGSRSCAKGLRVVAYLKFRGGARFDTAGGGNAFMAHVGKYADWRLIQTVPFEEDEELFAAEVDGSLCATVDAEYGLPDGAIKPCAAGAAEIGPWYYGGACPRCGALAPIAQDGRKGQASILHYLRGRGPS